MADDSEEPVFKYDNISEDISNVSRVDAISRIAASKAHIVSLISMYDSPRG
jgi:hypothetical protein